MKNFGSYLAASLIGLLLPLSAECADTASCGVMNVGDQCHIHWSFSRDSTSYYFVQQFDPLQATWHTVVELPAGTTAEAAYNNPVEGGYLYRVMACDDPVGETNCLGSTMVWAPYIQPEDEIHLIPSRVPLVGSEKKFGQPIYGAVDKEPIYGAFNKKESWLTAVIQYNVYQMLNAIARANISDLPDMTPVKDLRVEESPSSVDHVQFNVYWAYSAERGAPIDSPMVAPAELPPHVHPERHPN